ncbi:metalloregulator ArsR/SmtB family transcription factor [Sphingomonas sp. BIUV-7]|uniref:Metalloregulator ArsR/SmtB family transcription factor n=1 Tax=Sphingomonas natans TaxID=3063330 RepID=A0ABT8Y5Z1_9SPHN|nr:metalloregulator ArsR/SmtB family transcription factor [Sphingomonas sp. BIUV-7]MDO6413085.1 metalloregulator ArsR/SmtB family transcription factor [Sphingomonas sp. BIUV-7]
MPAPLAVFRALADPTRLRIVALLRQMELSVGELAQVLGQSQPRVSRHVKILADADLCDRRREGSWIFLGLGAAARHGPLLAAIDGWEDPSAERWAIADAARLAAVRADRMAAAETYFNQHAAEWDAIRSLHVAEAQVEGAIVDLLDAPLGRLVDIGTGTGRMIELLLDRADSAVGIDRSPEMLRLARAKVPQDGRVRTELRQGDMYALPILDAGADTVVLHQVLHYAQAPAAAIAEAGRTLSDEGRLLIVDFAAHDREELRERDAHVRLGFDDAQIESWFDAAGLDLAATRELRGGELTVKLWLGARRVESRHLKAVA